MFNLPLGLIKSTYPYAGQDEDESKDVSNFLQARNSCKGVKKFRARPSETEKIDFHGKGFIKMIILIYEAL